MTDSRELLRQGDGLLVVDVQRCFSAGGSLAINDADAVVPVLNRWIEAAVQREIPVYASRDWHPLHHVSFREEGGDWPPHCIVDTDDAGFHPDLRLPESTIIISKGVRFDRDQVSVFDGTGLAAQLRRDGVVRLWVGGLALDVCVAASVLSALAEGFRVTLIRDGTRPVTEKGGREALRRLREAGAEVV